MYEVSPFTPIGRLALLPTCSTGSEKFFKFSGFSNHQNGVVRFQHNTKKDSAISHPTVFHSSQLLRNMDLLADMGKAQKACDLTSPSECL